MSEEFHRWVQQRLTAHGHPVRTNGAWGGQSRDALGAFQRAKRLKATEVTDRKTIAALRRPPKGSALAIPAVDPPAEIMPPWAVEMERRRGLHEKRDNGVLSRWLRGGRFLGDPARLPWCGDAIETAIVRTLPHEPVPDNPFWAQAWKGFGIDAGGPVIGSIGVIRWNARSGHVGIVMAYDPVRHRVLLLGGNQSNAITLQWFDERKFIAWRWPKTFPIRDYPQFTAARAGTGSLMGTR